MSTVLIATIAGLLTALCWGTSDYLSARGTRQLNPFQINMGAQVTSTIMIAGLFMVAGIHITALADWLRIIASSLLINLAYVIFMQALSGGVIGIIVPLSNTYPLITIILSILFLHSRYDALQFGAMAVILLGVGTLAYQKNHERVPLRVLHRKTLIATIAVLVWGVGFFVLSPSTQHVSWQSISIVSEMTSLTFALILLVVTSRQRFVRDLKESITSGTALVAGIIGESGLIAFYLGSTQAGGVVIPAVLSACGPLVTSMWGVLFDHERVGALKRWGAVVTVSGIIILNLA